MRLNKFTVLSALALSTLTGLATAQTAPANIVIPGERIFPESFTSDKKGNIIVGSVGTGTIFRAAPGTVMAGAWIQPGTDGLNQVFGVFADDASNTLWACSNLLGGAPGTPPAAPSTLYAFDLTSGASKGHYPFVTAGGFCNDIAVGADGSVYATDSNNMEVERLPKGGQALEMWVGNGAIGAKGGGVDGIAMIDGRVVVNTISTSKLYATAIAANGKAGKTIELTLDRAIERPDGMRSNGSKELLIAEGGSGGRLSRVMIDGDNGKVTTLKQGFPDGPVAVTVVGKTAYVLEGQLAGMRAKPDANAKPKPFQATAVPLTAP